MKIETILFSTVDEYIQISKEKYGYNAEQALGMLFWHKVSARSFEATYYDFLKQEYINVPSSPFQHDLDRAVQDLANFTPFPDEWSVEDKVLFEQAFQFHGKSFHRCVNHSFQFHIEKSQ